MPDSGLTTSPAPPLVAPGDDPQSLAVGVDVAGYGGVGTDVGDVHLAGVERFDDRRTRVEEDRLDGDIGTQRLGEVSPRKTQDRLAMRDVGEIAHPHDAREPRART